MENMEAAKVKILERVRKLLALSTSPNENEAEAAAAKAQAILSEHNLSMNDIKAHDPKPLNYSIDSDERTDSRPWRRGLANMCAKLYFCKYYFTFDKELAPQRGNGYIRYDIHSFVGEPHNVLIAKMLFLFLSSTVHRLATEASLRKPAKGRTAYRDSFMKGCAYRLCIRLHDRWEAAKRGELKGEGGTNLPALLDLYTSTEQRLNDWLKERQGKAMSVHRRKGKSTNIEGILDGRAAADKIGLDQQVGQAEKHKRQLS